MNCEIEWKDVKVSRQETAWIWRAEVLRGKIQILDLSICSDLTARSKALEPVGWSIRFFFAGPRPGAA